MHDTAFRIGGLIMQTYCDLANARILDVGAYDINGSLRSHALPTTDYVGVDIEMGPGVDALIEVGKPYPFEDNSFDLVMASSVFEHDPAFWNTFIEMCRKTKAGGHIYVSAPANGTFHRHPDDNWRFYPDAGTALVRWALSQGEEVELVESFVADRQAVWWNDFCAVFRKGPSQAPLNTDFVYQRVPCANVHTWQSAEILNLRDTSEDMDIISSSTARIAELQHEVGSVEERFSVRIKQLEDAHHLLNESWHQINKELQARTEEYHQREAELAEVGAREQGYIAERLRLEGELGASRAELEPLRNKVSDLENNLRQRQEEIEQAWTALNAAKQERDAITSERDALVIAEGQLREKLTESEAWVYRLAGDRKTAEDQVVEVKRLLSDERRRAAVAEGKAIQASESLDRAQAELREVATAQGRSEAQLIDQIRLHEDELQRAAQEGRSTHQQLEQRVATLKAAVAEATRSLSREQESSFRISADLSAIQAKKLALENERNLALQGKALSDERLKWLSEVNTALTGQRGWRTFLPAKARRKWEVRKLAREGLFDANTYLDRYPDVAETGIDPLGHFIRHGMHEGRLNGLESPSSFGPSAGATDEAEQDDLLMGTKTYDANLPTILIANHDASRTGAPLVGLNVARGLERYNIFTFLGRDEELTPEFLECSVGLILGSKSADKMISLIARLQQDYALKAILINSVESGDWIPIANASGVPVVSLIHEFSEYTLPVSKSTNAVRLSDRVIVPAKLVEESLQREVQLICSARAPNIVVRHQGALPYLPQERATATALSAHDIREFVAKLGLGQRHIVLGAGYAQPRKGVDLFVQTAGYVAQQRDDVVFLWVGSGYQPTVDLQYSKWIEQTIERMGLKNHVLFLPSQPNLDACFEASDLFYLPSRLDPFPNVVIDALMASRDVVCFEGATGCAELFDASVGFRGTAVPYADVQAAGDAIIELIDHSPRDDFNARKAADYFNFESYLAVIESELETACANAAINEAEARRLLEHGLVDRAHYAPHAPNADAPTRDYVASSRKGLAWRNPRPGFSENWWRTCHPGLTEVCPLIAELDAGEEWPQTHRFEMLDNVGPSPSGALRVALHLHLHFSELADEFAHRLSLSGIPVDIFATVTTDQAKHTVHHAFRNYKHGRVETVLVLNRGRDIGPLLTELRKPLNSYDIVGHLHGKRSLDSGDGVGSRWLAFLLDTLLGSDNGVLAQIIGKFEARPELGLLFPEDSHNVGWSANRSIAESLAQRTTPPLVLPSHPFFPLGTMFWARREALEPLWNANLTRDDMPLEPLPYDGTILHALERMLPAACEASGLEWQTVSVPGAKW